MIIKVRSADGVDGILSLQPRGFEEEEKDLKEDTQEFNDYVGSHAMATAHLLLQTLPAQVMDELCRVLSEYTNLTKLIKDATSEDEEMKVRKMRGVFLNALKSEAEKRAVQWKEEEE